MPRIFNRLSILLSLFACSFLWMSATQAATKTICALGCDYTSISAAFVGDGAANEVYAVQNSYNPGSESWPITFPTVSSTVTCVGGPVIDQPVPTGGDFINLSTSSTISGCTFGNVYVLSSPVGGNPPSGIQLLNNMFSNSVTSTIQLANGATNFVISGNTNINLLALQATSTNGLIENNTFYGRGGFYGFIPSAYMLEADTSSTNDQFIHNTFVSYVSGLGGLGDLIQIDGSNQTFATNTIQYATTPPTGLNTAVEINASGTNTITGNYIETPSNGGLCNGLYIDPTQHFDVPWTGSFTVRNNTIHLAGSCSGPNDGIVFDDYRSHRASTDSITLDMEYNLLDNAYPAVSDRSGIELDTSSTNVYTITGDYNGAYRFATTTEDIVNNDFRHPSYPDGPHSILATPYLFEDYVLGSASLDVAPFSPYLDVDGVNNIGASTGVRRSIIHVNQTGPIDFSTIDATSTDGDFNPTNFLRSGDTLSFAAGTYNGFTVDSSYVTSSITVEGVGVGTVIQARPNQDALTFTNVTSSYIQNLTVENATGVSGSYSITRMNFGYGGNSYNEAVPPYSIPTNTTFIMEDGGCSITPYGADGQNISSEVGSAVNNWHIGLMNLGGGTYHETLLVPNNIATSAGEVGADCAGMGFAVDQFIANAFTVSGGVFTYNAAAVAGAGATLIGGSSTPAITGVMTANAGIRLTGTTSGTTISNVTSTNNGSGISFGATLNGGNTVSESVFNNNLDQDVFSASNATNTFDNVDFTRTSSTITGTAPIMVRYETRLLAERNGSLVAVSGASASSTDGYSFVTSLGTTSGSGFTSYADLPAYEITSGSNALTNGGYNPYSFNVAAVNYFASSTSQLLSHRNQTITLVMNSSVPPTAPSGATVISMGSTTSTIGWTDNSDNETSFLLNYIDLSAGQTFRGGVISSLAANTTSTLISGLVPDDYYRFRVAATGTIGLSTYATSSPFLTNLAVPNVPAVTALSETSESVTLDTNGNSTSTVYALYGSTLGSYLDTTGAVSSTEVWATSSTWGTITVSGLTCGTSYSFSVIARGQTGILSATSTPASVSTSGCSSLGGGGGGGSGGGGFYSVTTNSDGTVRSTYLGPIVNPAPIVGTSSSTSPSVTVVSSEVKSPPKHGSSHADLLEALSLKRDLAAETRGHRGVLEDAKAFHVKLTPGQIDDLSFFLAYGFSQTTAYLGERERRSILRDIFDVFGSGAITTQDIENLVTGRVPTQIRLTPARLRIRTRQIAPVFQRIYKHKPNLKNPHDALAWDVLLYHIRFSREIKKDAKGLADYRKLFKRAPVSPLDWAAVRAMGYVG